MTTLLLIVHLFVTLALIGVVLIQRSEGGGLGIGSSQGMGSFMTGRGTANLLTRATGVLGAIFFALSLALALLNRGTSGVGRSILDVPVSKTQAAAKPGTLHPIVPGSASSGPVPASPTAPTGPAALPPARNGAALSPAVPASPVPATPSH
jgi:preprotein translocase subunit SecG